MPATWDPATTIALQRGGLSEHARTVVRHGELTAILWRYDTGIEAVRLSASFRPARP